MAVEINFPKFLTLAEAAAILRVHRATVGRMVEAGEIPAIRVRGLPRIDAEALAGYIAGSTPPSAPASAPPGRPRKKGLRTRPAR
jgi:excisionase family DNA binding protein